MTRFKYTRSRSTPIAAPTYEMTATSCPEGTLPLTQSLHPHEPCKRRNSHFGDYDLNDVQCANSDRSAHSTTTRKRKSSSYGSASAYDDDCDDSRSSRTTMPDKKQNHSEIEKRRRDKMNTYITELSAMIPMCGAMSRKLDKLTVLRMAVQHLRTVRGSLSSCPLSARPRPAFLSERELNSLILEAANDSFLIVVGCDRGRLLYVSHSVNAMLHYDQAELLGQSMFDILHPKDVAKVKEQLSSSDLSPRERLIDAKTMLPVKSDVVAGAQRLCPGARRSFFCRIKCKQPPQPATTTTTPATATATATETAPPVKEETDSNIKLRKKNEKKYCVVQCTGYLKSWVTTEMENSSGVEGDDEQCTMSCLVAIGRALPDLAPSTAPSPSARPLQYISRHAIDGKFLFVDQRVTLALGFLPQELLGTSLYEYVSGPELGAVARAHKQALMQRDALHTPPYSFRRKNGSLATIQTHFKPFKNPWTKDVECLVANNSILPDAIGSDDAQLTYEAFKQTDEWRDYLTGIKGTMKDDRSDGDSEGNGGTAVERREVVDAPDSAVGASRTRSSDVPGDADVQRLIDSQVESHKIGSAIAEEAFRRSPSTSHLLQEPIFNASSLVDSMLGVDLSTFAVRSSSNSGGSNVPLNSQTPSPPLSTLAPLDGNGEAAMAVIMSLLEADAGLGGPVNFSGLPWPLP